MAEDIDKILQGEDKEQMVPSSRITELSGKVKTFAQEKEAAQQERDKAAQERDAALKEANFYKGFSTISSKYTNATEHIEDIKAKVLAGYDVEDAAVSVLAKAGKLSTPEKAREERETFAGGSAPTGRISESPSKPIEEMSIEEKRAALSSTEREGELRKILRI